MNGFDVGHVKKLTVLWSLIYDGSEEVIERGTDSQNWQKECGKSGECNVSRKGGRSGQRWQKWQKWQRGQKYGEKCGKGVHHQMRIDPMCSNKVSDKI